MSPDKLAKYEEMKQQLRQGSGEEKVAQQHKRGKLTARERIDQILDGGSFSESHAFMTSRSRDFGMEKHHYPGDGVLTGSGTIEGKQVWLASQDFTILGGSLGEQHAERIARAQDMALRTRSPFIQINDSGGARIQEGVLSLDGYGKIFRRNTKASGIIPQISLILGPCAGGAAYSPAITDFVFMVEKVSTMYITGPEVIRAVTQESVTQEELGGANAHSRKSGNVHFHCPDEASCFDTLKKLLSYLPASCESYPPVLETGDDRQRETESLAHIIPQEGTKAYDIRKAIQEVCDNDTFLEVHKNYAASIVVGFARIDGQSVGIVANQPLVLAGSLDIDSSDKASRFIRFCDSFHIPIVTMVDVPGYLPGVTQEHGGIIRHGAKFLYAIAEATVPKIALILRKAYGGAYIAMASRSLGYDRVLALPTAEIAVMGAEGAANIIFRREIQEAENPELLREIKTNAFRELFMNPYVAARLGMVDDVVHPKDARIELVKSLEVCKGFERGTANKHGNIPL